MTSRGGLKGGPRSNQHPAHSQLIGVLLVMSPNLCVFVSYYYMWAHEGCISSGMCQMIPIVMSIRQPDKEPFSQVEDND
jgi:hypothetical protein